VKEHWPACAPRSYLLGIPDRGVSLILYGVVQFSFDPLRQGG
jgi:hypothetical protein